MAIKYNNLDQSLKDRIANTAFVADRVQYVPAKFALNTLLAPSDITADDTVTIGSNVFVCKALTTDTTATASLATVAAGSLSTLTLSGAPGVTLNAGDLIRIGNEICKIVTKVSSTVYGVARGRCGTTIATHTTASVYQAAAVHATQIPFGVNATLTPAVWVQSLVAEINNATAGGARPTAKASTIYDPGNSDSLTEAQDLVARSGKVVASYIAASGAMGAAMFLRSAIGEASVLATTETLTAAGNIWLAAAMFGGVAAGLKQQFCAARVPTAGEVTQDAMYFYIPFTPGSIEVSVKVTATGIPKAWVGGALYNTTTKILTVTNEGATDWAATDTVTVQAFE